MRAAVAIPLLRKDFITHEVQLLEARAAGASAVLLIARALAPDRLRELLPYGIEEDARRKERMATEEVSAPLLDMKARVAEFEKEVRAEWEAAHGKKVADG